MQKKNSKIVFSGTRAVAVLVIGVITIGLVSWGLYSTVFKSGRASSGLMTATVTVQTPVYTKQPFEIKGTVFVTGDYKPEGESIYVLVEPQNSSTQQFATLGTIGADNKFTAFIDLENTGDYTVSLWRDEEYTIYVPQLAANATFSVTEGMPLVATINLSKVAGKTNTFVVSGTIAKKVKGKLSGYVSPITIIFANKFCTKAPLTVPVRVNPKTRVLPGYSATGIYSTTFTFDETACSGGFWVRPYYQKQWLKDSSGELLQVHSSEIGF